MSDFFNRLTLWHYAALALGLFVLQALVLHFMGQPAICTCGYVKLWENVVLSPGNSQHLSDWYTFSHLAHGVIFYYLLSRFAPRVPLGARLLLAFGIELSWEIFENTDMIINRYRESALAQGYIGDSILNSLMDSIAMVLGFFAAWRFPVWVTVALLIGVELFVGYMIRDNLLLNVIQLLHPFDFINEWQTAG
ncbi:DUF2585 domain-containing protein [Candidatus Parcubacteria bacterium]|nr:DUF2585 domain-containing protein [Candidatus Parcubacteria bacterium]